jgi:GxxExxY protein
MNTDEERINKVTEIIIGCCFKVHNELLSGFAEKVYENALVIELQEAGLGVRQQVPVVVQYRGIVVGDYIADLIVEDTVLIEIKAVRNLDDAHTAQCLNYLAATTMPVCLLINFGRRVEVKRLRGKAPN